MSTVTARGYNGTVTFDGAFVTIDRTGFLARSTIGKGSKRIPVGSITAVQWKQPGRLVNGFISFTLSGAAEKQSRFGSATDRAVRDENSVVVTRKEAPAFGPLREAVEQAIAARQQPAAPVASGPSLEDLAKAHSSGILTDAEFAAAKKKLLGI